MHDERVERIWREFHGKLRKFLVAKTGSQELAEDLLQEVFVKVHRSIDSLKNERVISSWLFRIARNAMVDHYRGLRHEQQIADGVDSADWSDRGSSDAAQKLADGLFDMLDDLPPRYREALRLTAVEGLSQVEMARRLKLSLSCGKSRVQRAKEHLRRLLAECCDIELDQHGGIVDYTIRKTCCTEA